MHEMFDLREGLPCWSYKWGVIMYTWDMWLGKLFGIGEEQEVEGDLSAALKKEREAFSSMHPHTRGIILKWRSREYVASIRQILEENPEFVMLNRTTHPLTESELEMLNRLDHERLVIYADDSMDLDRPTVYEVVETGGKKILGYYSLLQNILTELTHEQSSTIVADIFRERLTKAMR